MTPNKTTEERLRKEFGQTFPNLEWSTTGITLDMADWWLSKLEEECQRREADLNNEILELRDELSRAQDAINDHP